MLVEMSVAFVGVVDEVERVSVDVITSQVSLRAVCVNVARYAHIHARRMHRRIPCIGFTGVRLPFLIL